jgi:hypothetical protein
MGSGLQANRTGQQTERWSFKRPGTSSHSLSGLLSPYPGIAEISRPKSVPEGVDFVSALRVSRASAVQSLDQKSNHAAGVGEDHGVGVTENFGSSKEQMPKVGHFQSAQEGESPLKAHVANNFARAIPMRGQASGHAETIRQSPAKLLGNSQSESAGSAWEAAVSQSKDLVLEESGLVLFGGKISVRVGNSPDHSARLQNVPEHQVAPGSGRHFSARKMTDHRGIHVWHSQRESYKQLVGKVMNRISVDQFYAFGA